MTVSFNPKLPVIKANSVGPDQTQCCVPSDLGLQCFQCPKCPSPGLTNNPLSPLIGRHSDKNSAAINNRYLDFL